MAEPTTTAISVLKSLLAFLIIGIFILMAYIIAISIKVPKNSKEWVVSLLSTIAVSLGGGAIIIGHFDLYSYLINHVDEAHKYIGTLSVGFIFFLCGLIGWAFIRIVFNTIENSDEQDLFQIFNELKSIVKEDTPQPHDNSRRADDGKDKFKQH